MIEKSHLTALDGDEDIEGIDAKWSTFVDGLDGYLYGVPYNAPRAVKFDPISKSMEEIGPDFGEGGMKWGCGVRAVTNDCIYCAPCYAKYMLKINTKNGIVETMENTDLPESGDYLWVSGAVAADNHIYYMPADARYILRLNTYKDTLSSVGNDLGKGWNKYCGTVAGNNGFMYGIPDEANRILKFNPTDPHYNNVSFWCGQGTFGFSTNGVLGIDGNIYILNNHGRVLKLDDVNESLSWIGEDIPYPAGLKSPQWGNPIVGADNCIYWPPYRANRVIKFDPITQESPSLVGDDLRAQSDCPKWMAGALANNGVIYCVPDGGTNQVLAINPLEDFIAKLRNNISQSPLELGRLFEKRSSCGENLYMSAVRKFGVDKVLELIEKCLISFIEESIDQKKRYDYIVPPFVLAAACDNSQLTLVYHLLRNDVQAIFR